MTDESTPARDAEEEKLDEELDESFPASDPPSTWAARVDDDEADVDEGVAAARVDDDEDESKADDRRA